jgi:hypothetical protein
LSSPRTETILPKPIQSSLSQRSSSINSDSNPATQLQDYIDYLVNIKPAWTVQFESIYTALFDNRNNLENLHKIKQQEFKKLGILNSIRKQLQQYLQPWLSARYLEYKAAVQALLTL